MTFGLHSGEMQAGGFTGESNGPVVVFILFTDHESEFTFTPRISQEVPPNSLGDWLRISQPPGSWGEVLRYPSLQRIRARSEASSSINSSEMGQEAACRHS